MASCFPSKTLCRRLARLCTFQKRVIRTDCTVTEPEQKTVSEPKSEPEPEPLPEPEPEPLPQPEPEPEPEPDRSVLLGHHISVYRALAACGR